MQFRDFILDKWVTITSIISKLSLFFPSLRHKKNRSCTKFHNLHEDFLEEIIDGLRDESHTYKFCIYKEALLHWDTSNAGWIVWFDPKNYTKYLTLFLTKPIKKLVKYDPVLAFKSKKVHTWFKNKGEKFQKRRKKLNICTKISPRSP